MTPPGGLMAIGLFCVLRPEHFRTKWIPVQAQTDIAATVRILYTWPPAAGSAATLSVSVISREE